MIKWSFATSDFSDKERINLHKILRAIDTNVIFSKLTEADYCRTSETMIPLEELLEKFRITPKLLKTPNVLLLNVILNSNSKHPKQNHYTDSGEMTCNC
jgi:DNA polymerase-3 subunit alpha/error-prone DNA polymerase